MIRLAITVEGETEEDFVNDVLGPYLNGKETYSFPILIGKAASGVGGGGKVTIERLSADIASLYHRFDFVTSLVDLYGFRDSGGNSAEYVEVQMLREARRLVGRGMDSRKVIPYVQQYEFEGLLFSDVEALGSILGVAGQAEAQLVSVRSQFLTPEEINDDPNTAPSKRLVQILPNYNKARFGPLVAQEIGLPTIRAQCPRFDAWVTRLESLSA